MDEHATPDRTSTFDRGRLSGFSGGDPGLERELVDLFLETAALYVDRLKRAVDDPDAWRSTAHALKGASANIGAVAVAKLAAQQEQATPNLAALDSLVAEIAAVGALFDTGTTSI
ncbi:MAG: Hpt domain-containing protein [Pseudomonadota bacterium]